MHDECRPQEAATPPVLTVDNLGVSYGDGRMAHSDVNLTVNAGEFVCLLGPSGCGKTTLIHTVAGFVRPTLGQVLVKGVPVDGPGPDRGIVFQTLALFDWLSVRGNIEFGMRMAGRDPEQRNVHSTNLLERFGLADWADAYPFQLSGGMKQRVAIARTLVNQPQVLLMDEPFNSLDAETRADLQEFLGAITQGTRQTVLFVTHDIDEAIRLADRIVVLTGRPGMVLQEVRLPFSHPRLPDVAVSASGVEVKRAVLDAMRRAGKASRHVV